MAYNENEDDLLKLTANKEVRITLRNPSDKASVELIDGTGEIFGVEMLKNKVYNFTSSFSVSSSQGCFLKLKGNKLRTYTVNHDNNIYDLHLKLEEHRKYADENGEKGPIVMVAGPTDVGKSTLSRLLLNYATRVGRKPLYIDLDVGQSSISIPGTVGVLPIEEPSDIVTGFNDAKSSIYYFGYKSPGLNMLLYYLLIQKLGETLFNRLKSSQSMLSSGVIIDTCGWVTGGGYKSILLAAKSLNVNLLVALGDKRLFSNLKHDLPNINIKYFHKLEGVIERNKFVRAERRDNLIHQYFYGTQNSLKPYTFEVKFSEVQIFQVSTPSRKINIDQLQGAHRFMSLVPVSISHNLLNQILAVSYSNNADDTMLTSVMGFVCITSVDIPNQTLTLLSPQPKPLPKNLFIMGDIQYKQKQKS